MSDSLQGFKWYEKEQAEDYKKILSCYGLSLYTVDNRILKGFYYNGRFYNEDDADITAWVEAWMIPQHGENPQPA
jgi:hypothetical protein